ncbi:MAG: GNAT family N-acetyltransferase [Anaerolineae bacterium]|nr:GNAT family N-acetyltransferase [Anaerolineae bacterium]NUQ02336.1 GNAT family N-acetyltransferase [Anaerolineae bacterium]
MAEVTVRRALRMDMDAIAQMWMALVDHHQELDRRLPPAAGAGARRYAASLEERLDDPSTRILVAEIDGQSAGYVLAMIVDTMDDMFVHETSGFVADIYVKPEFRRDGVGRAMVGTLHQWFVESGVDFYEWHVAALNAGAVAFWEELGGKPVLVRMRKEIEEARS